MQTNLHRVSEFAVAINQTADDAKLKPEARSAVKRFREHDNDMESEVDDIVSSNISTAFQNSIGERVAAPESWHDSSKSEVADFDTTVFLSFNWENEEPYVKAVERYHCLLSLVSVSLNHISIVHFGLLSYLLWSFVLLLHMIFKCDVS
jgi:zinc finger FYVE domain-containing protein 26